MNNCNNKRREQSRQIVTVVQEVKKMQNDRMSAIVTEVTSAVNGRRNGNVEKIRSIAKRAIDATEKHELTFGQVQRVVQKVLSEETGTDVKVEYSTVRYALLNLAKGGKYETVKGPNGQTLRMKVTAKK